MKNISIGNKLIQFYKQPHRLYQHKNNINKAVLQLMDLIVIIGIY